MTKFPNRGLVLPSQANVLVSTQHVSDLPSRPLLNFQRLIRFVEQLSGNVRAIDKQRPRD